MRMLRNISILFLGFLAPRLEQIDEVIADIVEINNEFLVGASPQVQCLDDRLVQADIFIFFHRFVCLHPLRQLLQDVEEVEVFVQVFLHTVSTILHIEY